MKSFAKFWNDRLARVPAFRRDDNADVTLSVRGLRKLTEQAYRAGQQDTAKGKAGDWLSDWMNKYGS